MAHEDAGKYRAKHPTGASHDPVIADHLQQRAPEGRLTCVAAHDAAALLGVSPSEIGKTADLLEYRVVECQLGLFGYSPEKRIVKPAVSMSEALRSRLQDVSSDGRISCIACWDMADELGIERRAVADGCELLGIKVENCQLGAF